MSQSQQRIQRIAVGSAVAALVIAAVAVIATWRSDRRQPGAPEVRRVSASDLVKLRPGAIAQAEGGFRITDAALAGALGLAPGDVVTAISGRRIEHPHEVGGVLRELAILRPQSLFIDVLRDRAPVLARWELDGDIDVERRTADAAAAAAAGGSDPRIASIKQVNPTTFAVPRATVEAWTADPTAVTSSGRAVPIDAGPQRGFKLYAIRPGSAYAALGLEDGDVVRAINGTDLSSGEDALVQVARSSSQITLDLVRRGQPLMLNYLIK